MTSQFSDKAFTILTIITSPASCLITFLLPAHVPEVGAFISSSDILFFHLCFFMNVIAATFICLFFNLLFCGRSHLYSFRELPFIPSSTWLGHVSRFSKITCVVVCLLHLSMSSMRIGTTVSLIYSYILGGYPVWKSEYISFIPPSSLHLFMHSPTIY